MKALGLLSSAAFFTQNGPQKRALTGLRAPGWIGNSAPRASRWRNDKWEPWTRHPGSFVPHVSGLWGLCLWILPGIRNAVINTCLRSDMETAPSRNSDFGKYSSIQETAPLGRHFLSNKLDQRGLSSRMLALVCLFLIAALSCTPKATQCTKQYLHVPPPLRPSQKPSEFVCGREGRVINLAPLCLALISFWLKQNRAKLSCLPLCQTGGILICSTSADCFISFLSSLIYPTQSFPFGWFLGLIRVTESLRILSGLTDLLSPYENFPQ